MKTFIEIKTQFEFIHCWEQAPEEVNYLRNPHRHDFYVTCKIEVFHTDRELEFFMVTHKIEEFIQKLIKKVPITTSCELFATIICDFIKQEYGNRNVTVKVSEDNKSSAIVED